MSAVTLAPCSPGERHCSWGIMRSTASCRYSESTPAPARELCRDAGQWGGSPRGGAGGGLRVGTPGSGGVSTGGGGLCVGTPGTGGSLGGRGEGLRVGTPGTGGSLGGRGEVCVSGRRAVGGSPRGGGGLRVGTPGSGGGSLWGGRGEGLRVGTPGTGGVSRGGGGGKVCVSGRGALGGSPREGGEGLCVRTPGSGGGLRGGGAGGRSACWDAGHWGVSRGAGGRSACRDAFALGWMDWGLFAPRSSGRSPCPAQRHDVPAAGSAAQSGGNRPGKVPPPPRITTIHSGFNPPSCPAPPSC
ncbi:unnamed protein product [Lepidochelys kempii]